MSHSDVIVPALFDFVPSPAPEMYGDVVLPSPQRSEMSVGVVAACQDAADTAAVAIGRSQVKALACQLLNNSAAVGSAAGSDAGTQSTTDAGAVALGAVQRFKAASQSLRDVGPALRHPSSVVASAIPPSCITGGQSALSGKTPRKEPSNQPTTDTLPPSRGVTLRPDWFNFTMKCLPSEELAEVDRLKDVLGHSWQDMDFGALRYRRQVRCGSVWILWDGTAEGMGVHVQASGEGVSELEGRGVSDWRGWLRARLAEGARFARTDFAFDVRDGSLPLDKVQEAAAVGLVSSHFEKLQPIINYDGQGNVTDRGCNFGHRAADTSVVFYDKALEQKKKRLADGKKKPEMQDAVQKQKDLEASWAGSNRSLASPNSADSEINGGEGVELWTRCELRNRNARAQKLVEQIVAVGWSVVSGVLAAALDFKERGEGLQRCRWLSSRWWVDFLDGAEKARLILDPVVRSLQRGMMALERQYGSLLAACGAVVPDFWGWVQGVAARKLLRLSPNHHSMMAAYKEHTERVSSAGLSGDETRRDVFGSGGKAVPA